MKYVFLLLGFIILNFMIFLFDSPGLLVLVFSGCNLVLLKRKTNFRKYFHFLKKNFAFILFIFLCNLCFLTIEKSLLISGKLFVTLSLSYSLTSVMTPMHFAHSFETLLWPLNIFNVNIKNASLIITIAIAFVPILTDEARMVQDSLRSKGFEFSFIQVVSKPSVYLLTYLNSIFNRLDNLEMTLKMKGFE